MLNRLAKYEFKGTMMIMAATPENTEFPMYTYKTNKDKNISNGPAHM